MRMNIRSLMKAERYTVNYGIEELLRKERKGEYLNPEEKKAIKRYAEARRKENLQNKKKKKRKRK